MVDAKELEGRECYGGLDLASAVDIAAFELIFPSPDEEEEPHQTLSFF